MEIVNVSVSIRLSRTGRHKRPYYRIVVADSRKPRDGKFLEILGVYDPLAKEGKVTNFKQDRAEAWIAKGAQPSATVKELMRRIPKP